MQQLKLIELINIFDYLYFEALRVQLPVKWISDFKFDLTFDLHYVSNYKLFS